MIFPIYLDLIVIGSLLLWYSFYIVAKHSVEAIGRANLDSLQDAHSVTEKFLDRAELAFESIVFSVNRLLRLTALNILTRGIPYFRSATMSIEKRLLGVVGSLRGQHDISQMNREKGSDFVRDIKNHSAESRKLGGAIHE